MQPVDSFNFFNRTYVVDILPTFLPNWDDMVCTFIRIY